jgi:hypothetical protein
MAVMGKMRIGAGSSGRRPVPDPKVTAPGIACNDAVLTPDHGTRAGFRGAMDRGGAPG